MTLNDDFHSLISQLKIVEESSNYFYFNAWDNSNSKANEIIRKWMLHNTLSNEEEEFIDLYSKFQLGCVEYYLFKSQSTANNKDIIELFRRSFFKAKHINELKQAVIFIRDGQKSNTNKTNQDKMLIYLMRMLDARSFAYRLCLDELEPPPTDLNNEINLCLTCQDAKDHLYDMKSNTTISKMSPLSYYHRFFIGCCTLAIALFEKNKAGFQNVDNTNQDSKNTKYICLLAKYVRVVLSIKDFEENESFIYCLRGVLAYLTNRVPTQKWIPIINRALANPGDQVAQQANPFNVELFYSIIVRLLGSNTVQNRTMRSDRIDITSLVDIALVFLNKWYDNADDLNDDNNNENNNDTLCLNEQNQVLRLLNSNTLLDKEFNATRIIVPYTDAKYDRIRLMTISTLSRIMSNEDFDNLQNKKPNLGQDIVKLIFSFIDIALETGSTEYKGITLELLLRYLLRFLVQDFIKKETLPYLGKIILFAEKSYLNALKILRRLSSSPEIAKALTDNSTLDNFLKNTADTLFSNDPRMKKITEAIRQNLATSSAKEVPVFSHSTIRQAFISYSHRDKEQRIKLANLLRQHQIFENIWIDEECAKDNLIDSIIDGICQSQAVFVMLSNAYCSSDTCRSELEFALKKKIKVYPIFVYKDFKKESCDWLIFSMPNTLYYRLYDNEKLDLLIKNLKSDLRDKEKRQKIQTTELNESKAVALESTANFDSKCDNLKKTAVVKWTSNDIQSWCHSRKLEKWCDSLADYHGEALIELDRILQTDANLPHIAHAQDVTMMDVVLFKYELHKLLSSDKKHVRVTKKKH